MRQVAVVLPLCRLLLLPNATQHDPSGLQLQAYTASALSLMLAGFRCGSQAG